MNGKVIIIYYIIHRNKYTVNLQRNAIPQSAESAMDDNIV